MLKKFTALVLAILLIMAMSINVFAESVDFTKTSAHVNFENKAVDDYVREYLGIKTNRKLTISDCLKVKDFLIVDTNVLTTLNDIKYFPNLEYFAIVDQYRIIDISVLENCKNLTEFAIWNCNISDVSVLGKLKNLEYVAILENPVKDVSEVLSLPLLKGFMAAGTYINDISPLKGSKTLEYLDLNCPDLHDISALKNIKSLKSLFLDNIYVSSEQLTVLKTLNLTDLGLTYMGLTDKDMKYLKTQRNLEWLDLTGNYIKNFTFLDSFKNLQEFYFDFEEEYDEYEKVNFDFNVDFNWADLDIDMSEIIEFILSMLPEGTLENLDGFETILNELLAMFVNPDGEFDFASLFGLIFVLPFLSDILDQLGDFEDLNDLIGLLEGLDFGFDFSEVFEFSF